MDLNELCTFEEDAMKVQLRKCEANSYFWISTELVLLFYLNIRDGHL